MKKGRERMPPWQSLGFRALLVLGGNQEKAPDPSIDAAINCCVKRGAFKK